MTELKSYHINKTPFIIYNTENVIVFTARKIATQFLDKFYRTYLHNNIEYKFTIQKRGDRNGVQVFSPVGVTQESEIVSYLKKVVNNDYSIDKEIVILIRNPWKRYTSAFIQDYIKPMIYHTSPSDNLFFNFIFNNDFMYNKHKIDIKNKKTYIDVFRRYVENRKINFNKIVVDDITREVIEFLIKSIILIDSDNIRKYLSSTHLYFYHTPILELIQDANINPKIIDIDEHNLSDELSKYEKTPKKLDRYHSSNELTDIFNNLEGSTLFDEYKKTIQKELQHEIDSYNKLKNLNFNLDNSN